MSSLHTGMQDIQFQLPHSISHISFCLRSNYLIIPSVAEEFFLVKLAVVEQFLSSISPKHSAKPLQNKIIFEEFKVICINLHGRNCWQHGFFSKCFITNFNIFILIFLSVCMSVGGGRGENEMSQKGKLCPRHYVYS